VAVAVVASAQEKKEIVGSLRKRCCASCGDTVPVSWLWQVRQVRPLPPKVARSKSCLPSG